MAECLSPDQVTRYLNATVSLEQLRSVEDHLRACSRCRSLIREAATLTTRTLDAKLFVPEEVNCLDDDLLFRYVDGETDEVDLEIVQSHLSLCARCTHEVASLRAFRSQMQGYDWSEARAIARPAPARERWIEWLSRARRSVLVPAVAAAAVSLIILTVHLVSRPSDNFKDGRITVALFSDGIKVVGASESERRLISEKITRRGLPLVLSLDALPRRLNGTLPAARALRILRPYPDEVFYRTDPVIAWTAVEGANRYRVRIYARSDLTHPVFEAETNHTSVEPSVPGHGEFAGNVQALEVKAYSTTYYFRIPAPEEAERVSRSVEQLGSSHLLRGILFEKERVFELALKEYEAVRGQNSRSRMARTIHQALLDRLEGRR